MGVGLIFIAIGLAALLVFILVASRNRIVTLRHRVENSRHQMDVQLARRHDLIPALVEVVKGAMHYERETLAACRTGVFDDHTWSWCRLDRRWWVFNRVYLTLMGRYLPRELAFGVFLAA